MPGEKNIKKNVIIILLLCRVLEIGGSGKNWEQMAVFSSASGNIWIEVIIVKYYSKLTLHI